MRSQNPFSIYDLLGYLVPGFIFFVGITLINQLKEIDSIQCFDYVNFFEVEIFNQKNIIATIILSYLLGHLFSYLSSLSIEKFSVWSVGYPSKYLLDEKNDLNWTTYYFKLYFIKNNISLLKKIKTFILRTSVFIFLSPVTIPLIIACFFLNANDTIRKTVDPRMIKLIKESIKNRLSITLTDSDDTDIDTFRQVYHYVLERYPVHATKLQNYVALYGFTRTTSLIFNLLTWIYIIYTIINFKIFALLIIFVGMIISLLFYAAFNKFYRKFSLEAMMAVTSEPPSTLK